ncbi:MAG: nucleotidyltransferase domain-containing protein [Candidatus Pacearchaeota archaeon]
MIIKKKIEIVYEPLKDLVFLKQLIKKGKIHSVLLFGSYVKDEATLRSDVDVCVVAPKLKTIEDKVKLLREIWHNLNKPYDIWLFEELPLYMKISIIKNHKIIFSRNIPELYFYFYFYRKLWQDQAINRIEI